MNLWWSEVEQGKQGYARPRPRSPENDESGPEESASRRGAGGVVE